MEGTTLTRSDFAREISRTGGYPDLFVLLWLDAWRKRVDREIAAARTAPGAQAAL